MVFFRPVEDVLVYPNSFVLVKKGQEGHALTSYTEETSEKGGPPLSKHASGYTPVSAPVFSPLTIVSDSVPHGTKNMRFRCHSKAERSPFHLTDFIFANFLTQKPVLPKINTRERSLARMTPEPTSKQGPKP